MVSTDCSGLVKAGPEPNLFCVPSGEGCGEVDVANNEGAQEPRDHQETRPADIGPLPHFMIGINLVSLRWMLRTSRGLFTSASVSCAFGEGLNHVKCDLIQVKIEN